MLDYFYKRPVLLSVLHLMFLAASYIYIIYPFLYSERFFLGFDNAGYNFPEYIYFSNSILNGFGLPRWYPYDGGIPTGITHIPMISLLPHRILGYLLYQLFPPLTSYKINIVVGMLIIVIGWWLFLYQLIKSRLSATVGCLAFLLGGSGLSILHMEQGLATMTFIPWLCIVLIKIKERLSYILILAILIGFALTVHYPFHGLLTIIFMFLSLLLTGKLNYLFFERITKKKIFLSLVAVVFLILAASPLLYVINTKDDFASPVRLSRDIEVKSYEDYMKMSTLSSARIADLQEYLTVGAKDIYESANTVAFKITFIHIALAVIGICYYRMEVGYVIVMLLLAIWATLGINPSLSLPYLLFKIKFPFITHFRQWWHFVYMINFSLSLLVAFGFTPLSLLIKSTLNYFKISRYDGLYNNIVSTALTAFIIISIIYGSKLNSNEYMKIFARDSNHEISRYSLNLEMPRYNNKDQFTQALKTNIFEKPSTLFMYKEWWDLASECNKLVMPQTTSKKPFTTMNIFNDINNRTAFKTYLKQFCDESLPSHAVIASIPADRVKSINMPILDLSANGAGFELSDLTDNYYFSEDKFEVTPAGAHLKVNVPAPLFVVAPYNYKLGLKAYLNGQKIDTYPVYDGAMIGVFVPRGKFDLDFIMPFSSYQIAIVIQATLAIFIFIFLLYPHVSKRQIFLTLLTLIAGYIAYNGYFSGKIWIEEKKKQHIIEMAANAAPEKPAQQNLFPITNSSFETWHEINNIPIGWSYAQSGSAGGVYKEVDARNIKFGSSSARITRSSTGASQLYYTLSDEDARQLRGKTILFGGWIKSANTDYDKISLSITSLYIGQYAPSSYYQNTGEWEFVYFWYHIPNDTKAFNLYFNIDSNANADAHFDGAVLAVR